MLCAFYVARAWASTAFDCWVLDAHLCVAQCWLLLWIVLPCVKRLFANILLSRSLLGVVVAVVALWHMSQTPVQGCLLMGC